MKAPWMQETAKTVWVQRDPSPGRAACRIWDSVWLGEEGKWQGEHRLHVVGKQSLEYFQRARGSWV